MYDDDTRVHEATDDEAIRIAIRNLEEALADEPHRGMYVESARIWIRHL